MDIAANAIRLALRYDEQDLLHNVNDDTQQVEIWGAMQELEKRFGRKRKKHDRHNLWPIVGRT
jgi:hypothetical protein